MKELLDSENPYASRFVRGRHCLAVHEAGPSLGRTLTSEVDVVQKGSEFSWRDFADSCERCTLVRASIAEKIVGTTLTPSSSALSTLAGPFSDANRWRRLSHEDVCALDQNLAPRVVISIARQHRLQRQPPRSAFMCDRACRHDGWCRMCRLLFPGVACGARRSADRVARVIGFRGIMSSPRILPRTVAPPA